MTSAELIAKYEGRPNQQRLNRFLTYVYSTLIAIGIYAGLFFLFDIDGSILQKKSENRRNRAYIAFVNPELRDKHTDEIYAWAEVLNPALISLPNREFGFSEIRDHDFTKPLQGLSGYTFELPSLIREKPVKISFDLPTRRIESTLRENRTSLSVNTRDATTDASVDATAPVWTDSTGKVLAGISFPTKAVLNAQTEKLNQVFIGRALPVSGTVRVDVIQSSGSNVVDRQCAGAIRDHYEKRIALESLGHKADGILDWRVELYFVWQLNRGMYPHRKDWKQFYGGDDADD